MHVTTLSVLARGDAIDDKFKFHLDALPADFGPLRTVEDSDDGSDYDGYDGNPNFDASSRSQITAALGELVEIISEAVGIQLKHPDISFRSNTFDYRCSRDGARFENRQPTLPEDKKDKCRHMGLFQCESRLRFRLRSQKRTLCLSLRHLWHPPYVQPESAPMAQSDIEAQRDDDSGSVTEGLASHTPDRSSWSGPMAPPYIESESESDDDTESNWRRKRGWFGSDSDSIWSSSESDSDSDSLEHDIDEDLSERNSETDEKMLQVRAERLGQTFADILELFNDALARGDKRLVKRIMKVTSGFIRTAEEVAASQ
ncbi:hypothetical protein N7535_000133 [Penicillium sp. DV-2018c]|nr:hypothetical protein N7535_000133 [Penicillium sp. DV-2018c]